MSEDDFRGEDEGGFVGDDEDKEPYCVCGETCLDCNPDTCEDCDCDEQFFDEDE